jgi:hypothetical protein
MPEYVFVVLFMLFVVALFVMVSAATIIFHSYRYDTPCEKCGGFGYTTAWNHLEGVVTKKCGCVTSSNQT